MEWFVYSSSDIEAAIINDTIVLHSLLDKVAVNALRNQDLQDFFNGYVSSFHYFDALPVFQREKKLSMS